MRSFVLIATFLAITLAAPVVLPAVEAGHSTRIVMPYGQNERWIPVVAGYEVAPRPLGCDVGTIEATNVLYAEDFEGDVTDVKIASNIAQMHTPYYTNLWHVTSHINNEKGTDVGHSGDTRLYFGRDDTGLMRTGGSRLGGTASFPAFTIGLEPTFLSWNDKFEVEGLFGYDHLWVELVDQTDGKVYILCSTDTDLRPDKSSHDGAFSTCSPYRTMLCPTGIQGDGGLQCPGAVITPIGLCLPVPIDFEEFGLQQIDPTAPHWESRYVSVPTELVGRTVVPRFSYDSADGVANGYMGWQGDDVQVAIGVPNPQPYAYVPGVPSS